MFAENTNQRRPEDWGAGVARQMVTRTKCFNLLSCSYALETFAKSEQHPTAILFAQAVSVISLAYCSFSILLF